MKRKHDFIPRKAKIIKKIPLSPDSVGFRLEMTDKKPFNFRPGQFVLLSVLGFGEVPIGITTSPDEKRYFEVAVRSAGMVTKKICSLTEGDVIGVNGPFGNGFPLDRIKGKDLVIIAGGIGIFPLRSLIHHVKDKGIVSSLTILLGSSCPEALAYKEEYGRWRKYCDVRITVDECSPSWKENKGRITELFDIVDVKRGSVIIACGPPIMYDPIIKRYAGKTVAESDLYFMLERRMHCGIGKCQHCTCGKEYVCLDGPVFSYDRIKYNKEAL